MPVKRRLEKRRNTDAIRAAWRDPFEYGFQMFAGELEALGFDPEDREQHEAAWHEHGRWFLTEGRAEMARMRDIDLSQRDPPWALRAFGEPKRCL